MAFPGQAAAGQIQNTPKSKALAGTGGRYKFRSTQETGMKASACKSEGNGEIRLAVSLAAPVLGCVHVGGVEGGDGGAAEEAEGAFDIGAENFEGAGHAGIAGGGQAVGVGTADEYGAGAEADGFDRVAPAADSAIHQDFCAAVDGGDAFGERPNWGIDGIQVGG